MNDGVSLTSMAHPIIKSRLHEADEAGVISDDVAFYSLLPTSIEIDGDLIVLQSFYVRGRRFVTRQEMEAGYSMSVEVLIAAKIKDLTDTLMGWFVVHPPVYKWRIEPEIISQRDFISDSWLIQCYARGFFDVPRPLKDQVSIFEELPE